MLVMHVPFCDIMEAFRAVVPGLSSCFLGRTLIAQRTLPPAGGVEARAERGHVLRILGSRAQHEPGRPTVPV